MVPKDRLWSIFSIFSRRRPAPEVTTAGLPSAGHGCQVFYDSQLDRSVVSCESCGRLGTLSEYGDIQLTFNLNRHLRSVDTASSPFSTASATQATDGQTDADRRKNRLILANLLKNLNKST